MGLAPLVAPRSSVRVLLRPDAVRLGPLPRFCSWPAQRPVGAIREPAVSDGRSCVRYRARSGPGWGRAYHCNAASPQKPAISRLALEAGCCLLAIPNPDVGVCPRLASCGRRWHAWERLESGGHAARWNAWPSGRPTISPSSQARSFMTSGDRRPSVAGGVSGAPRQGAPIGTSYVEAAPRSRHPSEECVSYHGQAPDTCLWPQSRPGPLGRTFFEAALITSAIGGTANGRGSAGCSCATLRSLIGELRAIQPR